MSRKVAMYEMVHCGGQILILGNGPSSKTAALKKVGIQIVGLNQAWRLTWCPYLCMGDADQYRMFADMLKPPPPTPLDIRSVLFTPETGPEHAIRIQGYHNDPEHPKRFSFDLTEGVYLNNTIASFGFQLAVWMLGTHGTIYLLGIDSDGPQFDGTPMPPGTWENQRETLGYIAGILRGERPGIRIIDLSPVSKQRVFERKAFDEIFPG